MNKRQNDFNIGDLVLAHSKIEKKIIYIGYVKNIEEEDTFYDCVVQWIYPPNETECFAYDFSEVMRRVKDRTWEILPVK